MAGGRQGLGAAQAWGQRRDPRQETRLGRTSTEAKTPLPTGSSDETRQNEAAGGLLGQVSEPCQAKQGQRCRRRLGPQRGAHLHRRGLHVPLLRCQLLGRHAHRPAWGTAKWS